MGELDFQPSPPTWGEKRSKVGVCCFFYKICGFRILSTPALFTKTLQEFSEATAVKCVRLSLSSSSHEHPSVEKNDVFRKKTHLLLVLKEGEELRSYLGCMGFYSLELGAVTFLQHRSLQPKKPGNDLFLGLHMFVFKVYLTGKASRTERGTKT